MTNIDLQNKLVDYFRNNQDIWYKVGQLSLIFFGSEKDYKEKRSVYRKRLQKCLAHFLKIELIEVRKFSDNNFCYKWKNL